MREFIAFIKDLINREFTGQLRLNFHKGDISKKIELKENIKI